MSHRKSASKTGGLSPDAIPRGEQFAEQNDMDAMAGGSEASPGKRAQGRTLGMGGTQGFSSSTKKKRISNTVIMEEEGEEGAHDSQRMGEPNSVDQGSSSPSKRAAQPLGERPSDSFRGSRGPPAQNSS